VQVFRLGTDEPPQRQLPRGELVSLAASPDGRWLAAGDETGGVHVWEVDGVRRHVWAAHGAAVTALAFSADGKRLLTAGEDGTALVWLTAKLPRGAAKAPAPPPAACWEKLGGAGTESLRALAALAARGDEAVAFLKTKLAPAAPADPKELAALLQDLDSPQFGKRSRATRGLEELGERAAAALRAALPKAASGEAKRRLQALLARLDGPLPPARLREVRAVEALERLGSPAAVALLQALAQGAPAARLTREARASLERLQGP
jgi:hypothetical protein